MVNKYTKTTEYTRFDLKTKEINFILQKGASILMVYKYTKTTEYTKFNLKTKEINFNLQKRASIIMVYRHTKTTKYTKFNFREVQISILPYKKGLPYWWYTGIRRLQSIQDLILENFKYQFCLTKRDFHIDGIQVYEDYRGYKI